MNCDYNCNGYVNNPFGCGGCNTCGYTPIMGGFGCNNTGCSWFAIVLVVFLLLIICGNVNLFLTINEPLYHTGCPIFT